MHIKPKGLCILMKPTKNKLEKGNHLKLHTGNKQEPPYSY